MTATCPPARSIAPTAARSNIAYSICTLVTDQAQYDAMRTSFAGKGFDGSDCEYLYLDNTQSNQLDAFAALNRLIHEARGDIIILCHQDLILHDATRADLDNRLAELTKHDPRWAVAGNAGGISPGSLAIRITDPHGTDTRQGQFPARAQSLDENFLVLRADANLGLSTDLEGYHLYGADLCLQADLRGHTVYVIDFHLTHLSAGNKSDDFFTCEERFRQKYNNALRPRWIQTTCTLVGLSGHQSSANIKKLTAGAYAAMLRRSNRQPEAPIPHG